MLSYLVVLIFGFLDFFVVAVGVIDQILNFLVHVWRVQLFFRQQVEIIPVVWAPLHWNLVQVYL